MELKLFKVEQEDANIRLDKFLSKELEDISRTQIQDIIKTYSGEYAINKAFKYCVIQGP